MSSDDSAGSVEQRLEEAKRLAELGRTEGTKGDLDRALALHEEALSLLASDPDTPLKADILRWSGTVLRQLGAAAESEDRFKESLRVAVDIEYVEGEAHALNWLAIVAQRKGVMDEAASLYRRSARLATTVGDHRLAGMVEQNLGVLANIRGDLDGAFVRYRAALEDFERAHDQEGMSWVLNNIGMLHTDTGRFDEAREALNRGLSIARQRTDRQMECLFQLNLAESLITEGRWSEADAHCAEAQAIAESRKDPRGRAEAMKLRAVLQRESGALAESQGTLEQALVLARKGEDKLLVAELLREKGETGWREGKRTEARESWIDAMELFRSMDAVLDAQTIHDRLDLLDAHLSPPTP